MRRVERDASNSPFLNFSAGLVLPVAEELRALIADKPNTDLIQVIRSPARSAGRAMRS